MKLATAAKLPPYVVAQDRTLIELAEKRPQSEAALHDIIGLGASKIARYGAAFLAVIADYKKHPMLANRLSANVNRTLAAHLRGLDAEEIAAERGSMSARSMATLPKRSKRAYDGRRRAETRRRRRDEIEAAFERCHTRETGKLGPAFAALDGRYDYGILKCILAD